MTRAAAVAAAVGFAALAAFQLALAAGTPWGHAAWGGARAELTGPERTGSAVGAAVWAGAVLIVLGRAGLWRAPGPARLYRWGTWFLAAVSALAVLPNVASQSRWENAIVAPLALLLAILCTVVARR